MAVFGEGHKIVDNVPDGGQGLTGGGESDIIINDDDRKAVGRTISEQWYIYKDKKIVKIYPYHGDCVLTVKINGFDDYEIIEKKKYKPVGGE